MSDKLIKNSFLIEGGDEQFIEVCSRSGYLTAGYCSDKVGGVDFEGFKKQDLLRLAKAIENIANDMEG